MFATIFYGSVQIKLEDRLSERAVVRWTAKLFPQAPGGTGSTRTAAWLQDGPLNPADCRREVVGEPSVSAETCLRGGTTRVPGIRLAEQRRRSIQTEPVSW